MIRTRFRAIWNLLRPAWSTLQTRLDMRAAATACAGLALMSTCAHATAAAALAEYELKAAYVYNFASFTEWPADTGDTLTLCIYGPDPFGDAIDAFDDSALNGRRFQVVRINSVDQLGDCQIVFISNAVISNLRRVLDNTEQRPILTIADSPAAAVGGANINMFALEGKIGFEVNLTTVRNNGLDISFQLLRLAGKVYQ